MKNRFTAAQDEAILRFAEAREATNLKWSDLVIPGHTNAGAFKRWRILKARRQLVPSQKNYANFTQAEVDALWDAVNAGVPWSRMRIGNRTPDQLRYKWRKMKARRERRSPAHYFTEEEDDMLRNAVASGQRWGEIRINGRSGESLRQRWWYLQKLVRCGAPEPDAHLWFTAEEDARLCLEAARGVAWDDMRFPGRTPKALRSRWRKLNPSAAIVPAMNFFTADEDARLIEAVAKGHAWSKMRGFPGRTADALRRRWTKLEEETPAKPYDPAEVSFTRSAHARSERAYRALWLQARAAREAEEADVEDETEEEEEKDNMSILDFSSPDELKELEEALQGL